MHEWAGYWLYSAEDTKKKINRSNRANVLCFSCIMISCWLLVGYGNRIRIGGLAAVEPRMRPSIDRTHPSTLVLGVRTRSDFEFDQKFRINLEAGGGG